MKLHPYTIQTILDLHDQFENTFQDDNEIGTTKLSDFNSLISYIKDPSRKKLVSLISDLDSEVRAELIALMWLGRENGKAEDFEILKNHAIQESDLSDAEYVVSKKPLETYLREGIRIMGIAVEA